MQTRKGASIKKTVSATKSLEEETRKKSKVPYGDNEPLRSISRNYTFISAHSSAGSTKIFSCELKILS